ncbi:MAG: hypothetical protein U0694_00510 [Anaerolineae bacterium]
MPAPISGQAANCERFRSPPSQVLLDAGWGKALIVTRIRLVLM